MFSRSRVSRMWESNRESWGECTNKRPIPLVFSTLNKFSNDAYPGNDNDECSAFRVTSIDMSVTPANVSIWKCGSYIQVVYNAVFHVVSGPNGGSISFSYTVNNGRSQTFEKLTIIPGQYLSNFTFTWQGSLPPDHTYPAPGGVLVPSPTYFVPH